MPQFLILLIAIALLPACATTQADKAEESSHPLGTGSVQFVGFSSEELQDFRVIPEHGGELFAPRLGERIEDVDGFWWKPSDRLWFKIPDHCHTTISKGPHGLKSSPDCSTLGKRVQRLRGGVVEPGWQLDEGPTAHETNYPF